MEIGKEEKSGDDLSFEESVIQTPSIKVIKNSKGYGFEFKVLSLDVEEVDRVHNQIVEKIKKWREDDI